MAGMGRVQEMSQGWGPAERAAIDRCFFSSGPSPAGSGLSRPSLLSRTIESQIIPRLMLAHQPEPSKSEVWDERSAETADVAEMAGRAMSGDGAATLALAEGFLRDGHSLDSVLLDILSPAARLLGTMWEEDFCSFSDVSIGLSTLQRTLHVLTSRADVERPAQTQGRILLMLAPGDQHSFGASIVEGFFERAGWDVVNGCSFSRRELHRTLRSEWIDAVGVSLNCDVLLDGAVAAIRDARAASRNPSLFVLAGGRYFADHPDGAAQVGADAIASDAPAALRLAKARLVAHIVEVP